MRKILLITGHKDTGITYYRLTQPHSSIGFEVHQAKILQDEILTIDNDKLKQYSAVVFARYISLTNIKAIVDKLKSLNIKIWFDMDDYWNLDSTHAMCKTWDSLKVAKYTIESFKYADAVFTTTPKMQNLISAYNKNTYVFFNSVNPNEPQYTIREIKNKRIRIGWVGGVYHYNDILLLKDAFKKIWANKDLLDKIQICLGGYTEGQREYKEIEKIFTDNYVGIDSDYKQYLDSDTRMMQHVSFNKPYRRLYSKPVTDYVDLYNELDIVLVPLVKNSFNECKSNLKVVEAGIMNKLVIASNVHPYTIDCDYNNSILVEPHEWYEAIVKTVETYNKTKSLKLHSKIKERYLTADNRTEIYNKLLK